MFTLFGRDLYMYNNIHYCTQIIYDNAMMIATEATLYEQTNKKIVFIIFYIRFVVDGVAVVVI